MKVKKEEGFTLIELLIVVAIISIIAAIAVPGLLRARMTGNESSAIASLRTTTSSQVSYSAACGNGGYATSYDILGDAPPGGGQGFISAEFNAEAPILKSGYELELEGEGEGNSPDDCNEQSTAPGFYATAVPQAFGSTGTRNFAVNTNMTIFQHNEEGGVPATAAEGGMTPGTPVQ